jgi:hypothetical protein
MAYLLRPQGQQKPPLAELGGFAFAILREERPQHLSVRRAWLFPWAGPWSVAWAGAGWRSLGAPVLLRCGLRWAGRGKQHGKP